jgi:hypothetical protein
VPSYVMFATTDEDWVTRRPTIRCEVIDAPNKREARKVAKRIMACWRNYVEYALINSSDVSWYWRDGSSQ